MSDKDLPVVRLRWFSVNMRFFAPEMDPYCHVGHWTVRAQSPERATEIVEGYVHREFYDPASQGHYLQGGIPIDVWCFDTREIPPDYAALLDRNIVEEDSLDTGTPPPEKEFEGDNVIDLFSRRKKPTTGNDPTKGGGPPDDTPPKGA